MKHILVVDDEPSITTLLKYHLEKENMTVTVVHDGQAAYDAALNYLFDFIILDLMLPKLDGFEVTQLLRAEHIMTPIIMLTAKEDTVDKIIGLEMGADDYLTKPFSPRELMARLKAVERRGSRYKVEQVQPTELNNDSPTIVVGELIAYPEQFTVLKNDVPLSLTKKEYELLIYFMKRKGRIIDRDTLAQQLWEDELYQHSRTIDIHISHLREKIEDAPKNPQYLITVRGFGYKLQEPTL
ncbi:response regulator transcription factor [Vagococcus lutrae]|uniref:response regulator transcription factor n=1 Tax=Vagococcus lutrae TaxID=81947 RepID=UPI001C94881C|nr:response regulator transcription factor [Vagococcus lutrae]MDO5742231.1 response regulator transcription factor [Vagococcus sp.]QZN89052.1 response regulator transcription factor [Vagococcus lutrae]UQF23504.1 response regulator transcription factor [Vagococcus lutrae]UQF38840.1 response regulator transcription factor [Vagococcus lutrae]UQF64411.1 response regulator transcription factor [Vagococcus lutrae]